MIHRALGEHAAEEHSVLCAVLPCGRPVYPLAATTTEAVVKLLVPATQHGAGCGVRCQGAGALDPDMMESCALRTRSPLTRVSVGNV